MLNLLTFFFGSENEYKVSFQSTYVVNMATKAKFLICFEKDFGLILKVFLCQFLD